MPCPLASQGSPDENLSSLLKEGGDPETQLVAGAGALVQPCCHAQTQGTL